MFTQKTAEKAIELKQVEFDFLVSDEGKTYNSIYEGYAFLTASTEDAALQATICENMQKSLWQLVRQGRNQAVCERLQQLSERALEAAAEFARLAAVCEKLKGGL